MTNRILSQIRYIQITDKVNMYDFRSVQRIVYQNDSFELVNYIEEDPASYFHFILTGEEPKKDSIIIVEL